MKKFYKNTLEIGHKQNPIERIKSISNEIVSNADYLPKTVLYEDIDISFKKWVEEKIDLTQDGIKLPTMVLYSNQRFSEYLQSWKFTDENNNIRLNFKTITRENNPNHGTILGETYNIPGDRFYTIKSIDAIDESGKKYQLRYKVKQPTAIDIIYKVSIMTNKYTLLNKFNEVINNMFSAKQVYICPNGHYMPLTIESSSDESEYSIDDRQFFSQSFKIKVSGYIITENDMKVEECPIASIICFDSYSGKRKKPTIELSEYDPCFVYDGSYYKKNIEIDIEFYFCKPYKGKVNFIMDEDFTLNGLKFKKDSNLIENTLKLYINDVLITNDLFNDAYEGYKEFNGIPTDIDDKNTKIVDVIPQKNIKSHKYILLNNKYYYWHQIHFKENDNITIISERNLKHINIDNITLFGYNKLITI